MARIKPDRVVKCNALPFHIIGSCSTVKTESALIYTGRCCIWGIKGVTDGSNLLTLTIYDNTSAAGTVWDTIKIVGADYHGGCMYGIPFEMSNGIYVASSGGTHSYTVFYIETD